MTPRRAFACVAALLAAVATGWGATGARGALGSNNPASSLDSPPGIGRTAMTVRVVAHPDDDILFMAPDMRADVAAGGHSRTIYVTAGDGGRGQRYWRQREMASRAAIAQMADLPNQWTEGAIRVGGLRIPSAALAARPDISLVWLRLPDGDVGGQGFRSTGLGSLRKLWNGSVRSLRSVDGSVSFTRWALIAFLRKLITSGGPARVATMEEDGTYDCLPEKCLPRSDHSDHRAVTEFTEVALSGLPGLQTIKYLGYPSARLPLNLAPSEIDAKRRAFGTYAGLDRLACGNPQGCHGDPRSHDYARWLQRQYRVRHGAPSPSLDSG